MAQKPDQPKKRGRGRPPSGIRQAAREAGLPESTLRRHMKRARLMEDLQRIVGGPAALDAKSITAPSAEVSTLRRRIAELVAENRTLRLELKRWAPQVIEIEIK